LKTQRDFDWRDLSDYLGQETDDAIDAAAYPAVFMLQKSADSPRPGNKLK
jgi:hypothetical protein